MPLLSIQILPRLVRLEQASCSLWGVHWKLHERNLEIPLHRKDESRHFKHHGSFENCKLFRSWITDSLNQRVLDQRLLQCLRLVHPLLRSERRAIRFRWYEEVSLKNYTTQSVKRYTLQSSERNLVANSVQIRRKSQAWRNKGRGCWRRAKGKHGVSSR